MQFSKKNHRNSTQQSTLDKLSDKIIVWIGSVQSLIIHTIIFIIAFILPQLKILSFDEMLLILTTAVSLEAIYLAIFIQMSVNKNQKNIAYLQEDVTDIQGDIDEIQDDIDEIQEDIEEINDEEEEISEENTFSNEKKPEYIDALKAKVSKLQDHLNELHELL